MGFTAIIPGEQLPPDTDLDAWEHKFSPAIGDYLENGLNGETSRARKRRLHEGWFEKYCPSDQPGLDIGCSKDPVNYTFRRFDMIFGDGDANDMGDYPSNTYQTVYTSHVLEHMKYPVQAVKRWFDLVRPGGHLIISLPHRDLYEKRKTLPSQWNPDHKYFWLPETEEPPCTKSLKGVILEAIPNANIVDFRVIDTGFSAHVEPDQHPIGEYSIEAVIKK